MAYKSSVCKDVTAKAKRDRGAVLLMAAILLVASVGIVAFVYDANRAAASIEQARHYARLAALAAAEEYFDAVRLGSSDADAFDAAITRATTMSEFNRLLGNSEDKPMLKESGKGAALVSSGRWRTDDKTKGCETTPCFFEIAKGSLTPTNRATAFKISGDLFPKGVLTSFAKFAFGVDSIRLSVSAIASVIPRHGCFLIDNSGSMVTETHDSQFGYDSDKGTAWASGYDFALSPDEKISLKHKLLWDWMGTTHKTRAGAALDEPAATEHYQSDYVSKLVLGDDNYKLSADFSKYHPKAEIDAATSIDYRTGSAAPYRYRVDAFRKYKGDKTYFGPEPLRTVFSGLKTAVERFGKRSIAGDKMCFIFYDSKLSWPRVFPLTDDFDYLKKLTNFDVPTDKDGKIINLKDDAGDSITEGMLKASTGLELLIRHGLFPHANANTNTPIALRSAVRQLEVERKSSGIPSADFLVHLGDGMSNCSTKLGCQNDFDHFKESATEISNYITGKGGIFESRIPLHFIAMGSHIQPHTVDIKNAKTGKCYTDDEWRASAATPPKGYTPSDFTSGDGYDSFSFVNAGREDTDKKKIYFRYANRQMYDFSLMTTGLFGPIRPPRAMELKGEGDKKKLVCPPINCAAEDGKDTVKVGEKWLRVKDPDCHSEADQMNSYIDRIIGDNPFAIVKVD